MGEFGPLLHQPVIGVERSSLIDAEIVMLAINLDMHDCTRRGSNPQPSVPKTDALSN